MLKRRGGYKMTPEYIMPEDTGKGEGPGMPEDPNNPEKSQGEPPEGGLPPIGPPKEPPVAGEGSGESEGSKGEQPTPKQLRELAEALEAQQRGGDVDPKQAGRKLQEPQRTDDDSEHDNEVIEPDDPRRQVTEEEKEEEISELIKKHVTDRGGGEIDQKLGLLLNKDSSKEELLQAGLEMGISSDEMISMLKSAGHTDDTINFISLHKHGLDQNAAKKRGEAEEEMTDEERASFDEVQNDMKQLQAGLSKASGKLSKKEARELNEKANGMLAKLSDKLFAPGTGLLAEGNRMKTAAKVIFTTIITMAMLYAMLLHVATKWATKRIGSG